LPSESTELGFARRNPGRYFRRMSFAELKEEVMKLTAEQKAELAALLHGWEDDDWDRQMKADAEAGVFDEMLKRVDHDILAGRVRELP
jgi:hypothetical protein